MFLSFYVCEFLSYCGEVVILEALDKLEALDLLERLEALE